MTTRSHNGRSSGGAFSDAVVVGGGLNGVSTAYHLKLAGVDTVSIFSGTRDDRGASQAAVGLLRTHYDNPFEAALAAASMPSFANWEQEFGLPNGWLPTGFLRFVEPEEIDSLRTNVEIQHGLGVIAEILTPADVGSSHPYFDLHGIGAAVYEPDSGTADNWLCTTTLLAAAQREGVRVHRRDVTRLVADSSGVAAIETADGESHATRIIVLAAGAWSKPIAASIGLNLPLEARVISVGEILLPEALSHASAYMDPVTDSWLTPRPGGTALIALSDDHTGKAADPDTYPMEVSSECYAEGVQRVSKRVPALRTASVRSAWARLDTYAPDGKPILGAVDGIAGLYLNVAGAGKGHKIAPAVGKELSDWITNGSPSDALAPFVLSRFETGGFPVAEAEYRKRTIG